MIALVWWCLCVAFSWLKAIGGLVYSVRLIAAAAYWLNRSK